MLCLVLASKGTEIVLLSDVGGCMSIHFCRDLSNNNLDVISCICNPCELMIKGVHYQIVY